MGENIGNDEDIMPYITSANIACGFHAGDETSMQVTVRLAKRYDVAVGAHPSWKDVEGFGRHEMNLAPDEVESLLLSQISVIAAIAKSEGVELRHVKPHGALYNQATQDRVLANAIASAVKRFNKELILVGLAGSELIGAGIEIGMNAANEGVPDRYYNLDGTLVSRKRSNAMIDLPERVAKHAVRLAEHGIDFSGQRIRVDTLCLHGDHLQAVQNAKLVREALEESEIKIAAL